MSNKKVVNHFIRSIINNELNNGKHQHVYTRFPPEPNGYLHLGHAKSICLNFGLAEDFSGRCNLRFDDTNPEKEDEEYAQSIRDSIEWLGFQWEHLCYASDYFPHLYHFAIELIEKGLAYVDELTPEQIKEYRGTLTEAGKNSPYRNRPIKENLDLFERMKQGEFEEGSHCLRAKIDMSSPNMAMRDPILYRIRYAHHYRAGNEWCIYPMYDFTHCISDALEGITHSLCTLEFQDNRALYDWILSNISINQTYFNESLGVMPRQIEFGRSNLEYSIASKRKLIQLVNDGHVDGWDDPRLTTLVGLRRRGYTPNAIRNFCLDIGVSKKDSNIGMFVLENAIRKDLENSAKRAFGVLKPIKVIITNYPEGEQESFTVKNHPKDDSMGTRELPFSREIYIDADDFMLEPTEDFFRLGPDREVRLRYAYAIRCQDVILNEDSSIKELHCTYDPLTAKGKTPDGRKIKGIIHWVSAKHAIDAECRVYDRLFKTAQADSGGDFIRNLNPDSLTVFKGCKLEASLQYANQDDRFQFERVGYFCFDRIDHKDNHFVLNQTVSLRDSWKVKSK